MAASSRRSRSGQASNAGRGGRGVAHGHSHGHGPATPASPRLRTLITALLLPVAAAAVAGLALLWPPGAKPLALTANQTWVHGTVTASKLVPVGGEAGGATGAAGGTAGGAAGGTTGGETSGGAASGTAGGASGGASGDSSGIAGQDKSNNQLTIQITDGPTKGASASVTVGVDSATPRYAVGDDLVLVYDKSQPPEGQYDIRDFQRGPPLMSLAIAFALFVVVVGRWRGVGAIAALAVSFGVLVKFTLPAIVAGENSVEVAAVTAGVILFAAMYATHGVSVRTSVAVLGTAFSLALIGGLGEVSTKLAHLTGLGDESAQTVASLFGKVDVQGLLLAGIIIGALGVLNDVTATQVSSVWELKAADPSLGAAELFRAGMRIGRDHIGSTVNTLVLAYAGGSLPLFVLMTTSSQGWSGAAGAEVVAEEIVRTLVGSIGLAAAVPITTGLAAYFAAGEGDGEGDASQLSYTDLRERRNRRALIDGFDDDVPVTDDTLSGARLGSRRAVPGRGGSVPRMPESRRSGEWNTDGTRAGAGASELRRTGEWNLDGTRAGAGTSELRRTGEWNLDGTRAGTGTAAAPGTNDLHRTGEWNTDGTRATPGPAPADNRDLRRAAPRPMPYPAPPPQQPVDPYGQSPYGPSDPFENPQYYQ